MMIGHHVDKRIALKRVLGDNDTDRVIGADPDVASLLVSPLMVHCADHRLGSKSSRSGTNGADRIARDDLNVTDLVAELGLVELVRPTDYPTQLSCGGYRAVEDTGLAPLI
ncbi:hypothetical protein U1Q18_037123 [Sarracenia purpurea var. burkii]